jgi:hypothetical protein
MIYFSKYCDPVLTCVCFVYKMVMMYQTARKGMAWHPPIRVHPIPDSSLSELESEPEFEWEAELHDAEIEVEVLESSDS